METHTIITNVDSDLDRVTKNPNLALGWCQDNAHLFIGGTGGAQKFLEMHQAKKRGEPLTSAELEYFSRQRALVALAQQVEQAAEDAINQRTRGDLLREAVAAAGRELEKYRSVLAHHRAFIDSVNADTFLGWCRSGPTADAFIERKSFEFGRDLAGARASAEIIETLVLPELEQQLAAAERELADFTAELQRAA